MVSTARRMIKWKVVTLRRNHVSATQSAFVWRSESANCDGGTIIIDSVDLFYVAMPVVTDEGDGSQDALLVRVEAGGHVGWGECEASPLVSIAAFVAPMSHGACRPVRDAVLGKWIDGPDDIARIAAEVAWNSMDLLQAPHTLSGVEVALWDLLGKARGEPVWRLLGYDRSHPKLPYASVLFRETPQETLERGRAIRERGFAAAKFGWGPLTAVPCPGHGGAGRSRHAPPRPRHRGCARSCSTAPAASTWRCTRSWRSRAMK